MPTKDSKVKSVRVLDKTLEEIEPRLKRRKMTFNSWLLWCISLGLRNHTKHDDKR